MAVADSAAAAAAFAAGLSDERAVSSFLARHVPAAGASDLAAGQSGCCPLRPGAARYAQVALPFLPGGPLANTAQGLDGKRVAMFATFCGPPLQVFEIEMLFEPLEARLRARGAEVGERLAISSDYHPYFVFDEMRRFFRWISIKAFDRPLRDFTLDGDVGQAALKRFCDTLMAR